MAYFLKKSKIKKGLYLQVYESFYDPAKKQTAHRSVKALGYEHELKEQGIEDPVAHFKAEVDAMNAARRAERDGARARRIGEETPERFLGHFPLKAVNDSLDVKADLDLLQLAGGFRFSLSGMLCDLVFARTVAPCSKSRTFHDVVPRLAGAHAGYSLDQLYEGLGFLGSEYGKVIEIYNAHIASRWERDTARTYFDCTNFYFEIDSEDALRKKGPSKENKHDPIVGLGLLLDADCIPLSMKVYPGNESEKPVMREVIGQIKRRCGISGKTVRVADKGLNCADNVSDAILAGDGYLFSKSVKQLPKLEQAWVLSEEGWSDVADAGGKLAFRLKSCVSEFSYKVTDADGKKKAVEIEEKRVATFNPKLARKQLFEINRQVERARGLRLARAKRSEYGDCAKFVTFTAVDENGEEPDAGVVATLNRAAIQRARQLAGYNMIVTSEKNMADAEVYDTYHNLWRIEETFKTMKSQLDARPVYVQKPDTITGHFLVCYLAVLLERLVQVKVLDGRFSTEAVMDFVRGFRVVATSERKYVNISKASPVIDELERMTGLPLANYYLAKGQVDDILSCKL